MLGIVFLVAMDGEQTLMLLAGDINRSRVQRRSMKEKRKYKWFSIEKITGERWHIGAFIASDDFNQFYLMIALVKWNIYIGKIVDWDSMW